MLRAIELAMERLDFLEGWAERLEVFLVDLELEIELREERAQHVFAPSGIS